MKTLLRRLGLVRLARGLRRLLETRVCGTGLSSLIWRARHLYEGNAWIESYKTTIGHPHRALLAQELARFVPFESVLEAGACVGANLYLLAQRYPQATFCGVEINPEAVRRGNAWLKDAGLPNAHLVQGDLSALPAFGGRSFDLVITDAALMYVGPEKIESALSGLASRARRALVLNEWNVSGESRYLDGHWLHDYRLMLQKLFPGAEITLNRVPSGIWNDQNWDAYGSTIALILP